MTNVLLAMFAIKIVESLSEYGLQRRMKWIGRIATTIIILVAVFGGRGQFGDTVISFFGATVLSGFIFAPMFVFRLALDLRCRITATLALPITSLLGFSEIGRWILLFASDRCWFVEPIPL